VGGARLLPVKFSE